MKKTAKIILIVCCAALFLFLLLPFLETQAPRTGKTEDTAKTEPQIFTSNPLTELVGRIARFFKGRGSEQRREAGTRPMTNEETAELFGQPQEGTLYASAATASNETSSQTLAAGSGAYADAYLQNEEGEWVLIRQTSPEGASRGMHEINVKENAYERYIQQERQARFTPVMRHPKTAEVPDSKLARVFNPIKRLFGFGEDSAASASLASWNDDFAAGKLASSSGLDRNGEKTSKLPKTRPVNWNGFRNNPFSSMEPGSTEATKELADLIMPDAELKNMAEWLADIKYPNADNDPQVQQDKQDFIAQWMQEKYQQANEKASVILEEKAQNSEENTLFDMLSTCSAGNPSVKEACSNNLFQQKPEANVSVLKELNAGEFYKKTNLHLPPAGITVVLHKTDKDLPTGQDIQDLTEEAPTPEKQAALDMYHYMKEHCEGNCYWVATGKGPAQELQQTVEAAGLVMKGDPLSRHEQYVENFLAEQRNQGKTEEELQEMKEKLNTPYTAYTQEDLQQLHRQTMDLLLDRAKPEDASVPFFTQAGSAYQYYNDTGRKHPMFYGEGSATAEGSLQERSAALTNEVADFVNGWRPIIREIKQETSQEGITDLSAPKIQEILEQTNQDIKNFDANNDLGKPQK